MAVKYWRIPIGGWKRCIHDAASFESEPEFRAAKLLDADSSVIWWLRNDPVIFRIATPAGFFEPDFLYSAKRLGLQINGVLEIKGENLWGAPGSEARIKASSARLWAAAIHSAGHDPLWEFHEVLGQDAKNAKTVSEMLSQAVERYEVRPTASV
ncbi:hypothetical protein [Microvirga sesbaniae]|uniref:hypothetical protein n=1 Tax=Microvirga sesbaniae TaxID=681392 RepID=UPI0021C6E28D|nr:hypothetical protein [Microvirga sp. HBU67692]